LQERKSKFERASVDKFIVELEDVGDVLSKLTIGHDGSGMGAGWHLDKVVVRRVDDANTVSDLHPRVYSPSGPHHHDIPVWSLARRRRGRQAGTASTATVQYLQISRTLVPETAVKETLDRRGNVQVDNALPKQTRQGASIGLL